MPVDPEVLGYRVGEARRAIAELRRLTSKPFREFSVDEVYSMRYLVILLVEALVSMAVHVAVEEYNYRPSSYSDALEFLARSLGGLTSGCVEVLKAIVRLRNLLIHRYWEVDDSRVYESVTRDFTCIEAVLDGVAKRYGVY